VLGAPAAAPAFAAGVKAVVDLVSRRRAVRSRHVLAWAARIACIEPEELHRRCEASADLEELLRRTLSAAEDARQEKLVAYAVALVSGTMPKYRRGPGAMGDEVCPGSR
jgi:hypothetical protein